MNRDCINREIEKGERGGRRKEDSKLLASVSTYVFMKIERKRLGREEMGHTANYMCLCISMCVCAYRGREKGRERKREGKTENYSSGYCSGGD